MATKSIELKLNVVPTLDTKAVDNIVLSVERSLESIDFSLNGDGSFEALANDMQKAFDNLNVDDIVSQLENISSDKLVAAVEKYQQAIDNVDMGQMEQLIVDAAKDFDTTKKAAIDAYTQQKKAVAALAQGGKEGTAEYKKAVELLHEQKQAVDAIVEAEQKVNELVGEQLDGYDSMVETVAKFSAVGNLGESLQGATEKGVALRDALANAQAKTGATADEMKLLQQAAEDAFVAGVGESVADAVGAIATAKQALGDVFNADELKTFTVQAAAIGQVFDKDVNEVIGKSRTFIKNFGLDAQQAGDLLSLAMQGGSGAMDDVLDSLDEYSQLLVQTGFNAEETVGLYQRGIQAGARDTDKLNDTIKETQIRLKAGDIANALGDLNTPITKSIQGIVKAGEQGKISVKEVMQQSSQAIETAFDAGQITETMRSSLQVAISGTPAEDLGSELYARIFSSPIDVDAVKANAASAASTIASSLGAVTTFEKWQKEAELIGEKTSAFFAPITAGAGGLLQSVSQIAPAMTLVKESFPLEAVQAFGGKFLEIGKTALATLVPALGTVGATGELAFFGIELSAMAAWAAATLGVVALIALIVLFFTKTEAGRKIIAELAEGFEDFLSIVKVVFSNAIDILTGYFDLAITSLNPANWFTDDGQAEIQKKFNAVGTSILKTIKEAKGAIAENDLGRAIEKSATIKTDLDKNTGLQGLIAKFKNAKTEAEKNSIAEAIQKQVPSAVSGIKQITDAHGKVATVYDINIDKADSFAKAQAKAYNTDLQGQQDDYLNGLKEQVRKYDEGKAKLKSLADAMIAAANSGDTEHLKELQEEYSKLQEETNGQRDAIAKTVTAGEGLGIISKNGEEIRKKFGENSVAAKAITGAIEETKKAVKQTGVSAKDLADAFDKATQSAQGARDVATKANAEILLQMKSGELTREQGKKMIAEQTANARAAQKELDKQQIAIEQTESAILTLDEQRAISNERNEKSLATELSRIDYARKEIAIARELRTLNNQTSQEAVASFDNTQSQLTTLDTQIAEMKDKLKKGLFDGKGQKSALIKQLSELKGKRDELNAELPTLTLSVALENERDFIGFAGDARKAYEDAQIDVETLEQKIAKVQERLKKGLYQGAEQKKQFKEMVVDFENQKKEIEQNLPTLAVQASIESVDIQNAVRDTKIEMAKARIELNPLVSDDAIKEAVELLNQKAEDLQAQRTGLNLIDPTKDLELQKQIKDTFAQINDIRKTWYDASIAQLKQHYDERAALMETKLSAEVSTAQKFTELIGATEQRVADKNLQERLADIEQQKSDELVVFTAAIDARTLKQQQIEEKYNNAAVAAQQQYDEEKLFNEQRRAAVQLEIENAAALARLELQQNSLQEQQKVASEAGNIKEYFRISKELAGVQDEVALRGTAIGGAMLELQTTMTDLATNLINADSEAIKANYKKTFALIAGVLERQASAAISKIVVEYLFQDTSPWFVKLIAVPIIQSTVSGVVSKFMSPVLSSLTSFATGGRVDSPTLAVVGDARAKGGSTNTEWIFRDEQLRVVMATTANAAQQANNERFEKLERAIVQQRIVGVVSGRDLLLITQRADEDNRAGAIDIFARK